MQSNTLHLPSIWLVLAFAFIPFPFVSNSNKFYARASAVNITIDDEYGDALTGVVPTYLPLGPSINWNQGSTCVGCRAKANPSDAQNGTWHDTTYHPDSNATDPQRSIQIAFNGKYLSLYHLSQL